MVLTDCSICSPSQLCLLCQVPHWHHPSPAPVPDGHQDVHHYVKYFWVFKVFWQWLQAGEDLKDTLVLCTPQVKERTLTPMGALHMRLRPGPGLCSSGGSISMLINLMHNFVLKSWEHLATLMEMSWWRFSFKPYFVQFFKNICKEWLQIRFFAPVCGRAYEFH